MQRAENDSWLRYTFVYTIACLCNWNAMQQLISCNESNPKHVSWIWKFEKCKLMDNKYNKGFYAACDFITCKWGRTGWATCKVWSVSGTLMFWIALPSVWNFCGFLLQLAFGIIQGSFDQSCVLWCRANAITVRLWKVHKRTAEFKVFTIMEPLETLKAKVHVLGQSV